MTLRKRGLSRGLEALLKPDSTEIDEQTQESLRLGLKMEPDSNPQALERIFDVKKNDPLGPEISADNHRQVPALRQLLKASAVEANEVEQSALVLALFEHIRKENLTLLEEAEALKGLLEEFERILRRL